MLEPRETDIPALFLVLVVLPLVTYILLGKWSEASKKKQRLSFLAQLAAEEALKAETMAAASVIPLVPLSKNGIHECARCYGPATTRCSRCKSVCYCSGKCQIFHWREFHKQVCQQLANNSRNLSPFLSSNEELVDGILDGNSDSQWLLYKKKQLRHDKSPSDDAIHTHNIRFGTARTNSDTVEGTMMEERSVDKQVFHKSNRYISRRGDEAIQESSEEASMVGASCSTSSNFSGWRESHMRHKLKEGDSVLLEKDTVGRNNVRISHGRTSRGSMHENQNLQSQDETTYDSGNNFDLSDSFNASKYGKNACGFKTDLIDAEKFFMGGITSTVEAVQCNGSTESTKNRSSKVKSPSDHLSPKNCKSSKSSRELLCSDLESKEVDTIRDICHAQVSSGVSGMGIMRMIGLKKTPKGGRQEDSRVNGNRHKKMKMLFPYDEFVKFFQYEVLDLSPRGLINCGNSCYANAVLQCLTSTKPLTIYLLRRSHSKACCTKDWCLICELEQHVMMLRESGDPLSPGRILLHMRRINCQIGDGSQEDAHEFLRLLVTSMQSICLEGLGGENVVDPRLQETTFIQHTFGGRLRSKVKCLRCHHESERHENIMDLTLEIYGWVETLEDALTQFTSAEDLDGDNMYRCGRCVAYVRARKQLRIEEAPNILTIVLKRFQEGSYGKINKCITFPDMLDMIPFMTGTDDIPPLYMLYAVVVHMDTLNASFSGHYVSYVKNPQGYWFRTDDTEVQLVPLSQVMSEGAYILFYMRSWPRPTGACSGKPICHQAPGISKKWASNSHKSSRQGQNKSSCHYVGQESFLHHKAQKAMGFADQTMKGIHRNANRNGQPMMETCTQPMNMEFSDATSSDWSIFTSSDEASFTTESTRDSFSTVGHANGCSIDPITSIFNTSYAPDHLSSHQPVSCSTSTQPPDRIWKAENLKQVSVPLAGGFSCGSSCVLHVNCGSNSEAVPCRTGLCIL